MRLVIGSTVLALSALTLTTACGPLGVAAGAGAAVGTAASKEGGIGQTVTDKRIVLYISDAWFKHSTSMFNKLHLSVTEGRVLITGIVQNPQHRVDAVRIAWQAPGVKQVINEVKVENGEGFSGYSRDKWIATQLRSKLVFDKDIQSINYTTETVGGVVYVMGVAQGQDELNRVLAHARSIRYVREVVSYVRTRDQVPSYDNGGTGYSNTNSYKSSSSANGNTTVQRTTTTSQSAAPASSGNYDYQPESRGRSPVESSDLAPIN